MADLYAPQPQFINAEGAGQTQPQEQGQGITGDVEVDKYLQSLPESQREAALQRLTAPPTGEELNKRIQSGYNPSLEDFDAIESWHKNHEVNIIEGIGAGIEQVMGDLGRAVGAVVDHPFDVMSKTPANVVEGFAQGTRNFYGMAAQSADPASKLFRFKNFLSGTGSKEERYNQYMEALAFNRHSEELMTGKTTLVMDKDSINAEVVQAASYIADPTLFIPFGQVASAGMRAVGLGEKMMLAGAKAAAIKNGIIGGTLKWGVGAPVEFLGGAVRNTIDFGIERGASAIAATTGMAAEDIGKTLKLSGLPMTAAGFAGHTIPYVSAIAETRVVAGAAGGFGEAISAVGETMLKNRQFGRGINSWAREALENTPNLSGHAKGLLRVLDAVDPMFTYSAAVTQGAAHGAFIGGTLGYLSGGEEGFAHGLGAGIALGGVGATAGKVVADVTNGTLFERVAIQRKMVIEGLKVVDPDKATAFEALVKYAESSGDRSYIAHIDGIIAGIDKVAPNSKFFIRSTADHVNWLKGEGYDITTGRLAEANVKFKELGQDRRVRGRALGFLSQVGDQFAGDPDGFMKHLASLPQDHALRKAFFRLDGEQKKVMLEAIKNHGDPEFLKANGIEYADRVNNKNFKEWLDRNYEYFDPSNLENNTGELRRQLSTATGEKVTELTDRIKHLESVKDEYKQWTDKADAKTLAEADAHQRKIWEGRKTRPVAGVIEPKKARIAGKKLSEYYGDINYAEMSTARVNDLFATGDIAGARKLHETFLKDNTGKDGVLNDRGRMLRNKLAADGYLDKDGNLRPRRLTANDDQPTARMYAGNEGFVLKRDATGAIEVHLSLDNLSKDGAAHELFHAIFKESVLRPDFIDRLSKDLLGTFDKDGKLIKAGSINRRELRDFFSRYIDLTNDKLEDFKDESARLNSAIKEFEMGSESKTISPEAIATLHQYVEEFGAYYFQNWLRAQSPDFLFRGGKLEGMRGLMDSAKNGWLDFWERTFQSKDPKFRFGELAEGEIDGGFKTEGGKRIRVSSLDYFNRDFIRATADTNRGNFDINRLSQEGQAQYVNANGIRNTHRIDNTGRAVRLSRREAAKANAIAGKEIYKILKGINPNRAVDGDGNFIGRLNDAEMDAIVKSGHVNRAWVNKLKMAYDIIDGKQSNVAEFGYHGKTEQITDASYPRLFGDDVSFKHRKAILLGVDLKVGQNGTFHALFHTLDKAVIEARGDNLWKDSAIQDLWQGNRGSMEQDFFRYLENASKPDSDTSKRPSAELWTDGNGSKRRDALHQMLGMAKNEGDSYINRPIAEIPLGIRHSVTTFNNDGISSFRVSGTERYNYNHDNAFKLLSRNWKPSEMKSEKTGNGEIITHATGFKFIKNTDGTVRAFTSGGLKIGAFDNMELAAKASEKFSNSIYDNMQEALAKDVAHQSKQATQFKPLSREQRLRAIELGDVFALDEMKDFVGKRTLLRQTRDEHIYQRALEAVDNPEQLLALAEKVSEKNALTREEYNKQMRELTLQDQAFERQKWLDRDDYDKKIDELRTKHGIPESYEQWRHINGKKLPPAFKEGATIFDSDARNPEYGKQEQLLFNEYKEVSEKAIARLQADPEHQNEQFRWGMREDAYKTKAKELMAAEESLELWKKQNIDAIQDPVLAQLKSDEYASMSRQEKAERFAQLVQETAKINEYSGLLEGLFAREYDDKIQTGKPFVAVTTHGTGNVELMLARLYSADKLGSHYDIPSSRMGSFSAGSQGTSKAYARVATGADRSPAGRLKRLTAFLDENGYVDIHTEQYKVAQNFIHLYREYLTNKGHPPSLVEAFYKSFLHTIDKDAVHLELESVSKEVRDAWMKVEKMDDKTVLPDVNSKEKMQLRNVIRMDNPYVVVDPRSYDEHFISPHMKRAMDAGHDGIIFKRFADGGERDNVYVVFKDFMADNIKVIDSSFDGEFVPRGSDETGRVLKGGKQLHLPFKPREAVARRAEQAGYGRTVYYHGTNKQFTEFDAEAGKRASAGDDKAGYFFFTSQEGEAKNYAGMTNNKLSDKLTGEGEHTPAVMDVYLKMNNPYDVFEGTKRLTPENKEFIVSYLRKHGDYVSRDGMESKARFEVDKKNVDLHYLFKYLNRAQRAEMLEGVGFDGMQDGNHVVVFRPEQIKSAKDFTYDDAGVEIPLSDRFDKTKKDTRFKPVQYEGSDDYYKPKKNQFEYKDSEGMLVRRPWISNSEITGDPNARGHVTNPDLVGWEDVGHYPQIQETKAMNLWELKNSGLWVDDQKKGILAKNPAENDNTGYTHSEWFEKYQYDDDRPLVYGRYEKPRVVDGELKARGKLSIATRYSDHFNSMAEVYEYKSKVAKKLGVNPADIDAYYFGANSEIKKQLGYGSQDTLAIKFKPTEAGEGGKVYDQQGVRWKFGFIGRYASENPNVVEKKHIEVINKANGVIRVNMHDSSKTMTRNVGHVEFDKNGGISANIAPEYRGKGFAYVLYSEAAERMRAMGIKDAVGTIVNQFAIPVKVREKIFGDTRWIQKRGDQGVPINREQAQQAIELKRQRMRDAGESGAEWAGITVSNKIDPNAWYKPKERAKIGSNSSSVGLLFEGLQSGRLVRTTTYKGLGLEDANIIAHTPDSAKIGQVTVGDKALVDLQGGIFYAIANGEKIWASNFSGEGETNLLVNLANKAIVNNKKTGKTYIMLVKAGNDKIFASVDGARGVMSIFSHLSDSGVIKDEKLVRALRIAAMEELGLTGLDGLSKPDLVSRIDDALLRSNENEITFEKRALFSRDIARQLQNSGVFKSEKARQNLIDSFHTGFAGSKKTAEKAGTKRGFSIAEMERVFGNLMAEDIIKDVPEGHAYAAIEISKPLKESTRSDHRGYDASIMHEDESPAKLILFDRTAHITEVVNKRDNSPIKLSDPSRPLKDEQGKVVYEKDEQGNFKLRMNKDKKMVKIPVNEYEGEGSFISYTGGNIPYQEVRGKSAMPFKPAEGWRDWNSEKTTVGSVFKNTVGYLIMVSGDKFKVYNPSKAMVGIYTNLDQAKRRVQRDEPK